MPPSRDPSHSREGTHENGDGDDRARRRRLKKSYSVNCLVIDCNDAGCEAENDPITLKRPVEDRSTKYTLKRSNSVDHFDAGCTRTESKGELVLKVSSTVDGEKVKESNRNRRSRRRMKRTDPDDCRISDCGRRFCDDVSSMPKGSDVKAVAVNGRSLKQSNAKVIAEAACNDLVCESEHDLQKRSERTEESKERSRRRRLKKSSSAVGLNLNDVDVGSKGENVSLGQESVRSAETKAERTRRRRLKRSNSVDCLEFNSRMNDNENMSLKHKEMNSRESKEECIKKEKETRSIACQKELLNEEPKRSKEARDERAIPRRLKKSYSVACLIPDDLLKHPDQHSSSFKKSKKEKSKSKKERSVLAEDVIKEDSAHTRRSRLKKSMSTACLVDDGFEEATAKRQTAKIAKLRAKAKKKPPSTTEDAKKQKSKSPKRGVVTSHQGECAATNETKTKAVAPGDSPGATLTPDPTETDLIYHLKRQERKAFAVTDRMTTPEQPTKMDFSEAFAQVRSNHIALVNLDLSGMCLSTAQCSAFSMALKDNWFLKELHLVDIKVGPALGMILSHSLKQNKTLERLYLQSNNLGDVGAEALASAVYNNKTIRLLNLARNDIGDVGAAALAEALSAHQNSIKKLYLYENQIQDLGAEALGELIACDTSLEEIFVWENKFQAKGLRDLTSAVKLRYSSSPPRPIHLRVSWKTKIR